jgi:hypothetical protein
MKASKESEFMQNEISKETALNLTKNKKRK